MLLRKGENYYVNDLPKAELKVDEKFLSTS